MFSSHVLQPGEAEVWGGLVALGDAVHQVQQHLRVLLKLLHLHGVRQDHVQVEHQVTHLFNTQGHQTYSCAATAAAWSLYLLWAPPGLDITQVHVQVCWTNFFQYFSHCALSWDFSPANFGQLVSEESQPRQKCTSKLLIKAWNNHTEIPLGWWYCAILTSHLGLRLDCSGNVA